MSEKEACVHERVCARVCVSVGTWAWEEGECVCVRKRERVGGWNVGSLLLDVKQLITQQKRIGPKLESAAEAQTKTETGISRSWDQTSKTVIRTIPMHFQPFLGSENCAKNWTNFMLEKMQVIVKWLAASSIILDHQWLTRPIEFLNSFSTVPLLTIFVVLACH